MKLTHVLALCAISLTVASCNPKLEKGTLATVKNLDELCSDSTNNGKRLAIEGYLHLSSDMHNVVDGEPQSIGICSEPAGEGSYLGWVYLNYGASKNSFSVPDKFDDSDIKVRDNEGNKLAYNDKITISFTVKRGFRQKYDSDTKKWVDTDVIECEYENVRIDKAQ